MARVFWMLRLDTLVDTLRRLRTVLCAAGRLVVSTSYLLYPGEEKRKG